jgi:hypothetical protein
MCAKGNIDRMVSCGLEGMFVRANSTFDEIERDVSMTPLGELLVPEV